MFVSCYFWFIPPFFKWFYAYPKRDNITLSLTPHIHKPIVPHNHTTSNTYHTCSEHWTTLTHTFLHIFLYCWHCLSYDFTCLSYRLTSRHHTPVCTQISLYCRVDQLSDHYDNYEDENKNTNTHLCLRFPQIIESEMDVVCERQTFMCM